MGDSMDNHRDSFSDRVCRLEKDVDACLDKQQRNSQELYDQLDKMYEHGRQKQNDQNDENRRLWDAIDNHRHDLKAVTEDSGQPMAVVSRPVSGSTSTSMGSTGYTRSLSSPSSHFS